MAQPQPLARPLSPPTGNNSDENAKPKPRTVAQSYWRRRHARSPRQEPALRRVVPVDGIAEQDPLREWRSPKAGTTSTAASDANSECGSKGDHKCTYGESSSNSISSISNGEEIIESTTTPLRSSRAPIVHKKKQQLADLSGDTMTNPHESPIVAVTTEETGKRGQPSTYDTNETAHTNMSTATGSVLSPLPSAHMSPTTTEGIAANVPSSVPSDAVSPTRTDRAIPYVPSPVGSAGNSTNYPSLVASVGNERSSTQRTSSETSHPIIGGLRLSHPDDKHNLTSVQCFVRSKLLEVFTVPCNNPEQPEVQSIVGIRCIHCGRLSKEERTRAHAFFPKSIEDIYAGVANWQCRHLSHCMHVPKQCRETHTRLKEEPKTVRNNIRTYWIESALANGLRNVDENRSGITLDPKSSPDDNATQLGNSTSDYNTLGNLDGSTIKKQNNNCPNGHPGNTTDVDEKSQEELADQANKKGEKNRKDQPGASNDVAVINSQTVGRKRGRAPINRDNMSQKDHPEMVQCNKCKTWHNLPNNVRGDDLPTKWHCTMITWAPAPTCCELIEPPFKRRQTGTSGLDISPSPLPFLSNRTLTSHDEKGKLHRDIILQQVKERVQLTTEHDAFYKKLLASVPSTAITSYSLASSTTTMGKTDFSSKKYLIPSIPKQNLKLIDWGRDKGQELNRNSSVIQIEVGKARISKRWIIPKRIPDKSGEYFHGDSSSVLFTPLQFVKNVITTAENHINEMDQRHHNWNATISPNDSSSPHSYIVEAEGTEKAMAIIKVSIQTFVRLEIERFNLKTLVNDGNSLVVDVNWVLDLQEDPSTQSLGARIGGAHIANTIGAYIKNIYADSILEQELGRNAINRGCALLAVNDEDITDASQVTDLIQEAKLNAASGDTSRIKLTLCLSKYADLSEADIAELNIRKRDGSAFDQVENESIRLANWIGSDQGLDQVFTQQHFKMAQEQTVSKAKVYDIEHSDSSDDGFKVSSTLQPKNTYKRKRPQIGSENHEKKRIKRQKEGNREYSPDNARNSACKENSTAKVERKRTANDGIKNFWHFEQKLKPLFSLDFKDTKINSKLVCSSMWRKHKELFGEDAICGENCRCIMWLPEMVESVIDDYIAREKEKNRTSETEDELRKQTRGICKYFAPRFVHLLEQEYPRENESRLITRLVGMWELHQKNRMYGFNCKKECGCEQEWDQMFGKGNKAQAKVFAKRTHLLNKRIASEASQSPVIPRKRKATAPPSIGKKQNDPTKTVNDTRKSLGTLISSMTSRQELFEVDFDSSIALGGYFRTEGNPTRCVVYSTYKDGQLAKNTRVFNGTTVLSVITGENRNSIHSHDDLKRFYENAKRTRNRLSILFDNQNGKPNNFDGEKEWDESGHWIGSGHFDENDGWPGGAKIVQKPQFTKAVAGTAASLARETSVGVMKESDSALKVTHNLIVPEWTSIVNTAEPGHKKRAPKKSLIVTESTFLADEPTESADASKQGIGKLIPSARKIRSRRKRTHSKHVKFSQPSNQEIFFCKNDAANVRKVLSNVRVESTEKSPQVPPNQTLSNAIRTGSCKDMLQILQTHPIEDLDLESVLQKEYYFVGNEIQKIQQINEKNDAPVGAERRSQENDFYAKYRALSIYIHCIHLIERAMCLKKWCVLDIELKYIDIVPENHTIVDLIKGDVSLKMQNGNMLNHLGPLPIRQFSQHMSFSDSDNALVFTVHNNKSLRFDQRDFLVDLKKGSLHGSAKNERNIGRFTLKLNDVEEKCVLDASPIEYSQSLSQDGSQEFSSGYVTITAKKRKADKGYIRDKQKDIIKKFHQLLAQIERFNQDPKIPSGTRLTGNIFGIDGKSILHAAIQLVDDIELVEKILKLGADPKCSGNLGIGTPLTLAQKNFYRASEREKNTYKNDADITVHEKRSNRARMLVETLQNHIIEPVAPVTDSSASSAMDCIRLPLTRTPSASPSLSTGTENNNNDHHKRPNQIEQAPIKPSSNDPTFKIDKETDAAERPKVTTRRVNTPAPVLPKLIQSEWFGFHPKFIRSLSKETVPANFRRCLNGDSCRFWKSRTCRFWHTLRDHSPSERKLPPASSLPALSDLPRLSKDLVEYKTEKDWVTAAYIDESTRAIIYVQKVLPDSGSVADDGTCWFRTKQSALFSLRYNVYFDMHRGSSPSTVRDRSNVADAGRNHEHDRNHHQRNQSHRQHKHKHQQQYNHHQHYPTPSGNRFYHDHDRHSSRSKHGNHDRYASRNNSNSNNNENHHSHSRYRY